MNRDAAVDRCLHPQIAGGHPLGPEQLVDVDSETQAVTACLRIVIDPAGDRDVGAPQTRRQRDDGRQRRPGRPRQQGDQGQGGDQGGLPSYQRDRDAGAQEGEQKRHRRIEQEDHHDARAPGDQQQRKGPPWQAAHGTLSDLASCL